MTGRECGSCQECCELVTVPELEKPGGQRCRHQCAIGCAIYRERPGSCATFRCLWLDGFLPKHLKPNKCGAVFTPAESTRTGQHLVAHVAPGFVSVVSRGALGRFIQLVNRTGKHVFVVAAGELVQTFPGEGVPAPRFEAIDAHLLPPKEATP